MRKIGTKNKALAFLLGLVYGYRGAHLELVLKDMEEFSEEEYKDCKVYYINRALGEVYSSMREEVTHVCVLREDKVNRKIILLIYKKSLN
ncbi:MAG: hypothetical protein ACK4SM_03095 [Aquificaceae bacterium]